MTFSSARDNKLNPRIEIFVVVLPSNKNFQNSSIRESRIRDLPRFSSILVGIYQQETLLR